MTRGLPHIPSILLRALRRPAGWIVFSLLLAGCENLAPVEYSQFENFMSSGIPQGWVGVFNPAPLDSMNFDRERYDVVLTVRFNRRSSSRNIVLDIEQFSLSADDADTIRVEMSLFSDQGKPLGSGNLGLYEMSDTLLRGVTVKEGYTVTVTTPLSPKETTGINAVGISLVRTDVTSPLNLKSLGLSF